MTYESSEGVSIFKSKDDVKAAWVIRAGLNSHALNECHSSGIHTYSKHSLLKMG